MCHAATAVRQRGCMRLRLHTRKNTKTVSLDYYESTHIHTYYMKIPHKDVPQDVIKGEIAYRMSEESISRLEENISSSGKTRHHYKLDHVHI